MVTDKQAWTSKVQKPSTNLRKRGPRSPGQAVEVKKRRVKRFKTLREEGHLRRLAQGEQVPPLGQERKRLKQHFSQHQKRKERIFGPLQNLFLSEYELELSRYRERPDSSSSEGIPI